MLTKHLRFIILLQVAFVESSHHGVVVNDEACRNGHLVLNDLTGTITSPLHPHGPPTPVFCSWLINNTNSDTLILSFGRFDLSEDIECSKKERDCCNHQWLQVEVPESSNENHARKHLIEDRWRGNANGALISNHSHKEADINPLSNFTIPKDGIELAVPRITPSKVRKTKKRKTRKIHFNEHHHDISLRSNHKKIVRLCGNIVPQPIITTTPTVIIKFYSDGKVHPGHMGFVLHYQITNNKTVCKLDEFNCGSPSLCIPESWRCNGQKECPDGLDEAKCLGCSGITESQRCDGLWHCQEGQDELGCFDCSADEWSCGENDECYKKSLRCDGTTDCHNGLDEAYCTCGRNQSQCSPNSAYCYDPLTQRCDGVLVCPGGEDEMDCGHCGGQGGLVGVHMIACSNKEECYSTSKRCDGVSECRDGSDEHSCSPQLCHPKHGAFLCANHHCIRDAWRCDQFDDCGDASDEDDCLRNSVIVAAAMGGLVCSLLLVIAVGCTCRLYALRLGLNNRIQNQRGSRRSTQLAPLTRLEQHLLQREPPPSYSVAVNDPSASLFGGSMCLGRGWRRQRRRTAGAGLGAISSEGPLVLPVPPSGYHPENSYTAANSSSTDENTSNSVLMTNEKEGNDEAKVSALAAASRQTREESRRDNSYSDDDDIPLLSAMSDEDDYSDEDMIVATNDNYEQENDVSILTLATDEQFTGTTNTNSSILSSMPGSSHSQDQTLEHYINVKDKRSDSIIINLTGNEDNLGEIQTNEIVSSYDSESSETSSLISEVTDNDTHAAVLALSVVRHHTELVIGEATDTELLTQELLSDEG